MVAAFFVEKGEDVESSRGKIEKCRAGQGRDKDRDEYPSIIGHMAGMEISADICYNISYKYMIDKDGVQNSQIDVAGGHYVEGSCSKRYKPGSGI